LSDNYFIETDCNLTCHTFKYINKDKLTKINIEMKKILKTQQYIFDNFINYISFINSTENLTQNIFIENIVDKQNRGFRK
jgi:hypothetical protein